MPRREYSANSSIALASMKDLSDLERERLTRTLAAIPDDARNGLEIGFNDLRVTRLLAQRIDLVSIDIPRGVDSAAGFRLAFADIRNLPFGDKAFDVVVCTEVLEHLSDSALIRGARELQRVARKYLLITVPYRQNLQVAVFKCADCGYICHAHGHIQSFDEERLSSFFPGVRTVEMTTIARIPGTAPSWMCVATHRLGNSWDPLAGDECPACKASARLPKENVLGFLGRRLLWRMAKFARPSPAWLLARFAV